MDIDNFPASKSTFGKDECKLALMAMGHEIWLGGAKIEGEQATLGLYYGHNMRPDGVGDPQRITPVIYTPQATPLKALLTPEGDRLLMTFKTQGHGYYTVIADQGAVIISQTKDGYEMGPKNKFRDVIYSGAFHQMAKRILTVGEADGFKAEMVHGILEIVPERPVCATGDTLNLEVYYEGERLPSEEIIAISEKEGTQMAAAKTDQTGKASFAITRDGDWMFLVRHRDPNKKVNEAFDESVFVCTLVMEAK